MFELKISGSTMEEFQANLKLACINFLQEEKTNVSFSQGQELLIAKQVEVPLPKTENKENKNESKKRQKRRKEEVITSLSTLGEDVNDLNDSPNLQSELIQDSQDEDISPEENRRIVKSLELKWAQECKRLLINAQLENKVIQDKLGALWKHARGLEYSKICNENKDIPLPVAMALAEEKLNSLLNGVEKETK